MTVTVKGTTAELVGAVTVEDAEPLAAFLRARPGGKVGLRRCTALHTAALQLLLAARPAVVGTPADPFLATHVLPLLRQPAPLPLPAQEPAPTTEEAVA